jgi:hypothetical protein
MLFLAVLLCAGSGTQKVQRAALVPHQQPNQRSGQPIGDNHQELAFGTSTLSVITDPKEAPDANAGLFIPRYHISGAARFRASRRLDVGLLWDYGLDKGSKAIQDGQPPVDNGDVFGGGLSMHYSAAAGDDVNIGIGIDMLLYSIPYVEYRTCIDPPCIPEFDSVTRERDTIPVVAVGLTPSWKLSPQIAAFGGVTARNHPTIPRTEIEGPQLFEDDPVEAGPLNFIANAGVEYTLANGMRAMVHVFQPIFADPVRYGPTFGAQFTIPLGRDKPAVGPLPVTAGR